MVIYIHLNPAGCYWFPPSPRLPSIYKPITAFDKLYFLGTEVMYVNNLAL